MNILELAILKKMVGGGGGSGTDNYNDLSNLPQINGETLAGNKTAENLGLQDALTFDSTPTEDSTNPVKSGGVYSALAGKQDNLTFDGVYNASTNKAATESTVTNAIAGLDVSAFSVDADETISSISETDGKVSVTKQDIAIASNQVVAMTGYTKPSSAPSNPAIQTGDTANQAFGKLEFKADTNQSNILSVKQKVGVNLLHTNEFSGGTSDTGIDFTTENGIISAKGTKLVADSYRNIARDDFKASSQYYVVATTTGSPRISLRVFGYKNGSYTQLIDTAGTAIFDTSDYESFLTRVVVGGSINDTVNASISAMIITKEDYDAGLTEFQPYGAPNYDLTRLEAEDRAELVELVDDGAKNEFSCFYINAPNARGLTFTDNHNGSITITGNNNGAGDSIAAIRQFTSSEMSAMAGYIMTGVPTNSYNVTLFIQKDGSPYNNVAEIGANETDVIESVNYSCTAFLMIPKGTQNVNVTVWPMICSKPKYTISPKYIFNGYKQPVKHANITTIEAGGYVKLGKLVNVVIRCVVGSECAAYTSLFTGLPFPASGLSAGANFVACASNQSVPIIVCANGTIQNGEVLPAMTQLLISATYICL